MLFRSVGVDDELSIANAESVIHQRELDLIGRGRPLSKHELAYGLRLKDARNIQHRKTSAVRENAHLFLPARDWEDPQMRPGNRRQHHATVRSG